MLNNVKYFNEIWFGVKVMKIVKCYIDEGKKVVDLIKN